MEKIEEHTHEWVIIDTYDSKNRPPITVLECVERSREPHYTSETWACSCGKRKVNSRKIPSILDRIKSE